MAGSSSSSPSTSALAIAAAAAATTAAALAYYWNKSNTSSKKSKSRQTPPPPPSENGSNDNDEKVSAMVQERFEQCALHIKKSSSGSISQSVQLELYGFYKQATMGDCDIEKPPPAYDVVAKAKYQAWEVHRGMSRTAAMQGYIDKAVWLEFTRDMNQDEHEFTGEDYEEDKDNHIMDMHGMGSRPSTLMGNDDEDENGESHKDDAKEFPLHAAAQSNDFEAIRSLLKENATTAKDGYQNAVDPSGQTALHLAADRGHLESVKALVEAGANVNAADHDGIGVLQAAVIGGNFDVCRYLLEDCGADPDKPDDDGDTPRQCAQDDPALKDLFEKITTKEKTKDVNGVTDAQQEEDDTFPMITPTNTAPSRDDDENECEATPRKTNKTMSVEVPEPEKSAPAPLRFNPTWDTAASEDANDLTPLDYIPMELDDDGDM